MRHRQGRQKPAGDVGRAWQRQPERALDGTNSTTDGRTVSQTKRRPTVHLLSCCHSWRLALASLLPVLPLFSSVLCVLCARPHAPVRARGTQKQKAKNRREAFAKAAAEAGQPASGQGARRGREEGAGRSHTRVTLLVLVSACPLCCGRCLQWTLNHGPPAPFNWRHRNCRCKRTGAFRGENKCAGALVLEPQRRHRGLPCRAARVGCRDNESATGQLARQTTVRRSAVRRHVDQRRGLCVCSRGGLCVRLYVGVSAFLPFVSRGAARLWEWTGLGRAASDGAARSRRNTLDMFSFDSLFKSIPPSNQPTHCSPIRTCRVSCPCLVPRSCSVVQPSCALLFLRCLGAVSLAAAVAVG